jgi:hypothetical protein
MRSAAYGALLIALTSFACLEPAAEVCASGRVCSPGTVCDDARDRCVSDDQRAACDGQPDDVSCRYGGVDGTCRGGFCEPFVCGDGVVTEPEDCEPGDPPDLAGKSCATEGFYDAPGLACNADCTFDTTACTGWCGDGETNGPEGCDGADLADMTCLDFDYYRPGGLACNPASCTFDLSGCQETCGDDMVNGTEACDGAPPTTLSCVDVGYDLGLLDCTGICTPAVDDCLRYGWTPVDAGTIDDLASVWAAADDDIFVLGDAGVRRFDGVSWTEMTGAPVACGDRSEIWGRSASDLYVATCDGLHHWDGSAWSHVWTDVELLGIGPAGDTEIYATGWDGLVLRFDGSSWSDMTTGLPEPIWDIAGTGPGDLYTVEPFEMRHYDGNDWSIITTTMTVSGGQYTSIDVAGGTLFVGVTGFVGGSVFRRVGSTWTRADIGAVWALRATAADRAVAVTLNGGIFQFDGRRWSAARGGGGAALSQVFAADIGAAFAVGDGGLVLRYDGVFPVAHDAADWRIEDLWAVPGTGELYAVGCELDAVAGTAWPTIYYYDGEIWREELQLFSDMGCYTGIWGSSAGDIHVVAEDFSGSRRWTGSDWDFATGIGARDVWGWSPTQAVAVGFEHASHWNGASWTSVDLAPAWLRSVWGPSASDVYAVGDDGVVVHYDGGGWTALSSPTSDDFTFVWGTGASEIYAGTDTGTLYRYDGAGWTTALELPGLALHAAAGTAPDDIFVAAGNGALYHFDGNRWAPVRSDSAADLLALLVSPRRIAAAGDFPGFVELQRDRFWHCAAAELCADGMDNDCDDLVDAADPDCP